MLSYRHSTNNRTNEWPNKAFFNIEPATETKINIECHNKHVKYNSKGFFNVQPWFNWSFWTRYSFKWGNVLILCCCFLLLLLSCSTKNIYMQKFLDSHWSRAVQFSCNTSMEICNTKANYKIQKYWVAVFEVWFRYIFRCLQTQNNTGICEVTDPV